MLELLLIFCASYIISRGLSYLNVMINILSYFIWYDGHGFLITIHSGVNYLIIGCGRLYFQNMTLTIPLQKQRLYSLPLSMSKSLKFSPSIECVRNYAVWLLRLDHKRQYDVHLVLSLGPLCKASELMCERSAYSTVTMLKRL